VSGTDLNGSYKPSVFFESSQVLTSVQEERRSHRRDDSSDSDPNILQRPRPTGTLYHARYDYLKREESIDTAIAGNLRRYSKVDRGENDDWMESFNMSLDFTAVPSTTKEEQVEMPFSGRFVRGTTERYVEPSEPQHQQQFVTQANFKGPITFARSWSSESLSQSQESITLMNDSNANDVALVEASPLMETAAAMRTTAATTNTNTTTTDTNVIGSLVSFGSVPQGIRL
jgi:hypothetical protein